MQTMATEGLIIFRNVGDFLFSWQVGAETVSDSMVMLLMVSFVFTGIAIRRYNSTAAAAAAAKVSETLRVEQERLTMLLEEQHYQIRRLQERLDVLEAKMASCEPSGAQKVGL